MTLLKILGAETAANAAGPQTFNGNTAGVTGNRVVITNRFANGQQLVYSVATGNTAVTGLANGSTYYAVSANSIGLNLSATLGGANLAISTACTSAAETGHTLFGVVSQGNIQTIRAYNTNAANTLYISSNTGALLGSITVTNTEVLYIQKGMTDTLWCNGASAVNVAPVALKG